MLHVTKSLSQVPSNVNPVHSHGNNHVSDCDRYLTDRGQCWALWQKHTVHKSRYPVDTGKMTGGKKARPIRLVRPSAGRLQHN